eukprot:TRINITY_DN2894_c0_g2_i1.p1 TRINITY_DN2894_c0_g2~~TRINITY_DN2894_c0_g2_i1.p1  ORF type:complete len:951 (+),score=160.34 TRINITY_DN2894_c0_g2_i1:1695-4547(+)
MDSSQPEMESVEYEGPTLSPALISRDSKRNKPVKTVKVEYTNDDLIQRFATSVYADNLKLTQSEIGACARMFKKFDSDTNEEIDIFELSCIMKHLGLALEEGQLAELMSQVDLNNAGTINFIQFVHLMQLWKEAQLFKMFYDENTSTHLVHTRIDEAMKNQLEGKLTSDSHVRSGVYLLVMCFVLYYWIVVLHEDTSTDFDLFSGQITVEIIATIVFILDTCLTFKTAIVDFNDSLITESGEIARAYAKSGFLFVDVLSAFPLDLFIRAGGSTGIGYQVSRHFRLVRLLRVPYFFTPSEKVRLDAKYIHFHYGIRPILSILFWFMVIMHFLTEIWLLMKHREEGLEDYGYVRALYWVFYTVTTVGYGDELPTTDLQRIFSATVMIIGVVGNGLIIAKVISMLRNVDLEAERKDKLRGTLALLQRFDVPSTLEQEVLAFQAHVSSSGAANWEVISGLPASLQDSLGLHVRIKLISAVPFFKYHPACHVALAQCLKPLTARPDEYLVTYSEEGDSMYFILHGYADVTSGEGEYVSTLGKGRFFGELALLNDQPRIASVKAITYMDLLRLAKSEFRQLLPRFPKFHDDIITQSKKLYGETAIPVIPKTPSFVKVNNAPGSMMSKKESSLKPALSLPRSTNSPPPGERSLPHSLPRSPGPEMPLVVEAPTPRQPIIANLPPTANPLAGRDKLTLDKEETDTEDESHPETLPEPAASSIIKKAESEYVGEDALDRKNTTTIKQMLDSRSPLQVGLKPERVENPFLANVLRRRPTIPTGQNGSQDQFLEEPPPQTNNWRINAARRASINVNHIMSVDAQLSKVSENLTHAAEEIKPKFGLPGRTASYNSKAAFDEDYQFPPPARVGSFRSIKSLRTADDALELGKVHDDLEVLSTALRTALDAVDRLRDRERERPGLRRRESEEQLQRHPSSFSSFSRHNSMSPRISASKPPPPHP